VCISLSFLTKPGGLLSKKKKTPDSVNVLEHHLVPKMKVLSAEEKTRLLKKFGIDDTQLPRFMHNDPEVKALKAKIGDVVEIQREDVTGKYNSYRIVVKH